MSKIYGLHQKFVMLLNFILFHNIPYYTNDQYKTSSLLSFIIPLKKIYEIIFIYETRNFVFQIQFKCVDIHFKILKNTHTNTQI